MDPFLYKVYAYTYVPNTLIIIEKADWMVRVLHCLEVWRIN